MCSVGLSADSVIKLAANLSIPPWFILLSFVPLLFLLFLLHLVKGTAKFALFLSA